MSKFEVLVWDTGEVWARRFGGKSKKAFTTHNVIPKKLHRIIHIMSMMPHGTKETFPDESGWVYKAERWRPDDPLARTIIDITEGDYLEIIKRMEAEHSARTSVKHY